MPGIYQLAYAQNNYGRVRFYLNVCILKQYYLRKSSHLYYSPSFSNIFSLFRNCKNFFPSHGKVYTIYFTLQQRIAQNQSNGKQRLSFLQKSLPYFMASKCLYIITYINSDKFNVIFRTATRNFCSSRLNLFVSGYFSIIPQKLFS